MVNRQFNLSSAAKTTMIGIFKCFNPLLDCQRRFSPCGTGSCLRLVDLINLATVFSAPPSMRSERSDLRRSTFLAFSIIPARSFHVFVVVGVIPIHRLYIESLATFFPPPLYAGLDMFLVSSVLAVILTFYTQLSSESAKHSFFLPTTTTNSYYRFCHAVRSVTANGFDKTCASVCAFARVAFYCSMTPEGQ